MNLSVQSIFLASGICFASCFAAEPPLLPKNIDAAPCAKPPQIDGVIGKDEWNEAPLHSTSVSFVRIDPALTETRACTLRVMNSANALYVVLQVPDATADESITPLQLDAAMLAFNAGAELAPLSDRKVIAPGLYRDKHVLAGGKGDAEDAKQDGLGAMKREAGVATFEWAVPLNSGDKHDCQINAGESIRFNIAYFDALQLPFTKTIMGGLYGPVVDRATEWGTLRLAKSVKDDGGVAFRGPVWVDDVKRALNELSPSRLRVTSQAPLTGTASGAAVVGMTFSYVDAVGKPTEAQAKIYLPSTFSPDKRSAFPLFFAAGYEAPEAGVIPFLNRQWIVVTPSALPTNPLIRLMNPDVTLLHLSRRLPWIDDTKVIVSGGSAGGWMTLLLSAETFPLAGAAPDVPPVNWGYNAAYFFKQLDKAGPAAGKTAARIPALFGVGTALVPSVKVHGGDFNDETWFASSPVAHVSTITCPVSVCWSTADVLVPIDQVGSQWVQEFAPNTFPEGFTMNPTKLLTSREGCLTLIEALSKDDYELFSIEVPKGTRRQHGAEGTGKVEIRDLAVSKDKRWSITIVDEGPPTPDIDHRKYALLTTRNAFLDHVSTRTLDVDQLTLPKLRRLMARYAGMEWLPSRLKHLDLPENEQQDVLRGLRTYVSVSPAHAEAFAKLYASLPSDEQRLDEPAVKALSTPQSSGKDDEK